MLRVGPGVTGAVAIVARRPNDATASPHASGSSESTFSRARTSALRLVSCVDSVSIVRGHAPAARRGGVVEVRHRSAEHAGVATDLVERDQPVVAVERGVLDALGHDGGGELLEPLGELELAAGFGMLADGEVAEEARAAPGRDRAAARRRSRTAARDVAPLGSS